MLLYALSRGGWYTVFNAFTLVSGLVVSTAAGFRIQAVSGLLGAYTGIVESVGVHTESFMSRSVTLTFLDDQEIPHDAVIKVTDAFADNITIGSKLPVFYAVGYPDRIWLEPGIYLNHAIAALMIGLALICLSGIGLSLLWHQAKARLKLRINGHLTHATITERHSRDGTYGFSYRYLTESGETLTGVAQLRGDAASLAIMPGTKLEIVYDPEHPSRSAPVVELPALRG